MSEPKGRILIIEDDESVVAALRIYLKDLGYEAECASSGSLGLQIASSRQVSLIILDLGLPDMSGMDVCRELRRRRHFAPILMLTSRSDEMDKLIGFEAGADDYVTKPFGMVELIARVKALMRRSTGEFSVQPADAPDEISAGPLVLDHLRRTARIAERPIELTALEFDLLWLFITARGKVLSKEQLLEQVWGYSAPGYDSTVTTHVSRLRAKIEPDPENPVYIRTVWGKGYKFIIEE